MSERPRRRKKLVTYLAAAGLIVAGLFGSAWSAYRQNQLHEDLMYGVMLHNAADVADALNRGADLNAQLVLGGVRTDFWSYLRSLLHLGPTMKQGSQPILYAISHRQPEVARLLFRHGARISSGESGLDRAYRATTMWDAVRTGDIDIIRTVLDQGVGVDERDPWMKETPLDQAVESREKEIVRLLLDRGADPNAQDRLSWPPLAHAVAAQARPSVEMLLDHGAKIDLPGSGGETPLMLAVRRGGDPAIVKLLIDRGANPSLRNLRGETAYQIAQKVNRSESMKFWTRPESEQ